MSRSAPIWMLQKILVLDPQAIHASVNMTGVEMPVFFFVLPHVLRKNHPYALVLLEFLIKNGADLESAIKIATIQNNPDAYKKAQYLKDAVDNSPLFYAYILSFYGI
jgi:hypothetical protein